MGGRAAAVVYDEYFSFEPGVDAVAACGAGVAGEDGVVCAAEAEGGAAVVGVSVVGGCQVSGGDILYWEDIGTGRICVLPLFW